MGSDRYMEHNWLARLGSEERPAPENAKAQQPAVERPHDREFVAGAFYRVLFVRENGPAEWVPARYLPASARLRPDECWQPWGTIWSYPPDRMAEIGEMIAMEPPAYLMMENGMLFSCDRNPATLLGELIRHYGGLVGEDAIEEWRRICAHYDKPVCENS